MLGTNSRYRRTVCCSAKKVCRCGGWVNLKRPSWRRCEIGAARPRYARSQAPWCSAAGLHHRDDGDAQPLREGDADPHHGRAGEYTGEIMRDALRATKDQSSALAQFVDAMTEEESELL